MVPNTNSSCSLPEAVFIINSTFFFFNHLGYWIVEFCQLDVFSNSKSISQFEGPLDLIESGGGDLMMLLFANLVVLQA